MMATPASAAAVFLPAVVPIAAWVMWSDMARMKIPNRAVVALLVVFGVIGPFVLPLEHYGWRWTHVAIVIVIGFAMNIAGLIGAGDAKFAAAMSPFIAVEDTALVIRLFAAVVLASLLAHRGWRALPAAQALAPHWESWRRAKDFPMGLALGGFLVAYLGLCAAYGR